MAWPLLHFKLRGIDYYIGVYMWSANLKVAVFCVASVISSLAFADVQDATARDIAQLVEKLPPGIYSGHSGASNKETCSVNVRADESRYRVLIEPSTEAIGLTKKALFAAATGAPLSCTSSKGKISDGVLYCNSLIKDSQSLKELTVVLNADGSLKVSTTYSDLEGSSSGECIIRPK